MANVAVCLCALAMPSPSGFRTFFLAEKITANALPYHSAPAFIAPLWHLPSTDAKQKINV